MEGKYKIFKYDRSLVAYERDIELRMSNYKRKKKELVGDSGRLSDFANGHHYFGFHKSEKGWYYREWAPGAQEVYLTGDMVEWRWFDLKLEPVGNGVFEIFIPNKELLYDGCHVKTIIKHEGKFLERVPLYVNYTLQDPKTGAWSGVIIDREEYKWKNVDFKRARIPYIYECHIGMAQEKESIGSYREFRENILPRIKKLGYNTIQIMAVMEHPYYGSFGYQVSSFFAASSRYGHPYELKELIDAAHGMGIAVLLDVVHSHAVKNVGEGINEFDGTSSQFFKEGSEGDHPTWGTKLFNYEKNEVIHFLLSNLKFWLEEYHFDGFRFDGVTSMIYHDHGLGVSFTDYKKYFSMNTDVSAITYLQLANELVKEVSPRAVTIAEDMSGMPGMCLPIAYGGVGFDYRLAMGLPDLWINFVKEDGPDKWNIYKLWYELTSRRKREKYISYVESHDQALVGDKTLIFRLCDSKMYTNMSRDSNDMVVDRGIALVKLVRLLTASLGGEGYLNFMGNEFGHPEWIDFPREGNGWSHFYCRRQWSLADDPSLRYSYLNLFDEEMLRFLQRNGILSGSTELILIDDESKILAFKRANTVFVFNFNTERSYEGYEIPMNAIDGGYKVRFSTDEARFGGYDRIALNYVYKSNGRLKIYLPALSALCMKTCSDK